MYAVETAKMSSKGQLVIPEVFRKSYGWNAGMTILMVGTGSGVVLQPLSVPSDEQVDATIRAAAPAVMDVERRLKKAKRELAALDKLGISLPVGVEKSERTRSRRAEKHARTQTAQRGDGLDFRRIQGGRPDGRRGGGRTQPGDAVL